MAIDDVVDRLGQDRETGNKWVGVYVGILAVLLAICNVGGSNASKDAMRAHIEAANTWAFFQAKNIRRTTLGIAADDLELIGEGLAGASPEMRQRFADKVAAYREQSSRLTSEPERGEGLDELFARGKALELDRDTAFRKDPYFDWSQALLQIAIVLASVHLIIGSRGLLALSGGLGVAGVLLMLNGFTLAVNVPFLG
ncbi:MAG: DUF4337 domain-containing protein [Hyphomicrobiaceae bacterium]|nr:DUF4337 domain-containing protein [Hyphomicrobiaceae bacterium]